MLLQQKMPNSWFVKTFVLVNAAAGTPVMPGVPNHGLPFVQNSRCAKQRSIYS